MSYTFLSIYIRGCHSWFNLFLPRSSQLYRFFSFLLTFFQLHQLPAKSVIIFPWSLLLSSSRSRPHDFLRFINSLYLISASTISTTASLLSVSLYHTQTSLISFLQHKFLQPECINGVISEIREPSDDTSESDYLLSCTWFSGFHIWCWMETFIYLFIH